MLIRLLLLMLEMMLVKLFISMPVRLLEMLSLQLIMELRKLEILQFMLVQMVFMGIMMPQVLLGMLFLQRKNSISTYVGNYDDAGNPG